MRMRKIALVLSLCFAFFSNAQDANEQDLYTEQILNYHSDIEILNNCNVLITETIEVYALGNNIQRGIFRDLPLSYKYKGGNVHVGFNLISVKRDGHKEPYHTENMSNGIRIYAGSSDVYISNGIHKYQFTYEVDHVLGLFDEFDELYWNVNGNGWAFNINQVSATIHYPSGAKPIRHDAYTGKWGIQGNHFTVKEYEDSIHIATTRRFVSGENLTIAVAWEKDHLTYPTAAENLLYWIQSYILWIIGGMGIIIGFLFNFRMWSKHGRDPKPGTIIPLYYAPEGFSPAECVYLKQGGRKSDTMFGSMLISLAVKGLVEIDVDGNLGMFSKRTYTIKNLNIKPEKAKTPLTSVETYFYERLMGSNSTVSIESGKYNPKIQSTNTKLTTRIDKLQKDKYFVRNSHLKGKQFIMPLIVGVLGGFGYAFYGGTIAVLIGAFVLMLVMNFIFARLYEQPTAEGRKKMDEIAGFEMYLKYADKERIRLTNPPTMNFQHYEENLAYAIALGVAEEWAGQFNPADLEEAYTHHMPYFTGMAIADFGNLGSDLSRTISSASTPPSSSGSGSGGGGFSGGGGGGGGGGGW